MMSLTFIRGAGAAGALTLLHASTALALASGGATGPSPSTTTAAGAASAAPTGENTPLHITGNAVTSHTSSGGGSSTIVRTIVGLFIVIAVIYGVSWILRQAKRGSTRRAHGKGLAPVATLPLGSGRSLQLVRAGDELLLLGVAEHGVTPIRRYSEAEAIASGLDVEGTELTQTDSLTAGREERPGGRMLDLLRRLTIRS
jgi:flagellar protein FliO/FliZ